jgi:hypothetical protein
VKSRWPYRPERVNVPRPAMEVRSAEPWPAI